MALVWLKKFSFWPSRCDLKDQKNTGCVRLSPLNFSKGERPVLPELTPGKYDEITVRREANPNKGSPSAQTIIPSNRHFRHHSPGVLVPLHQYRPKCEVDLLLDFARITD